VKYKTFPLRIHKIIFWKPKWYDIMPRHVYQTSSKFSLSSFFSSPTTCCPSLPTMSAPLVWPGLFLSLLVLISGSLALWIWLSALALYLLLFVCLQVPVLLSGSVVLDPWLPWLVRVVEQHVEGCYWWWGGGGGLQYLYYVYCSICSCSKI
jgi:hypothetical protein